MFAHLHFHEKYLFVISEYQILLIVIMLFNRLYSLVMLSVIKLNYIQLYLSTLNAHLAFNSCS